MALTEMYRRSVDAFLERVARVRADQWHDPTPCADWDVRTLVNHIVYEQRWSVPLFAGATIAEVGDRFEGDLLGPDPLADARDAAEGAVMAATEQGTVHLSFGDTPAEEYMRQLFADHVIHGWDLAVGIGGDRTLDPAAVHEISVWFADREDGYRSAGAIGPRVEVGPDASEQDRLIAGFGRDPYR
jgi:uncharacterized protein (TIGR03086 family)